MTRAEAVALLRPAVPHGPGVWADLGAGAGTFTFALAMLLGEHGLIYAVDRDAHALAALAATDRPRGGARIETVEGDFTRLSVPGAELGSLDGLLLANALHFVKHAGAALARLEAWVRPGGHIVLIEYDRRAANPWVPYPIGASDLPQLALGAGLTVPRVVARRPSEFGGDLYVAVADKDPSRSQGS